MLKDFCCICSIENYRDLAILTKSQKKLYVGLETYLVKKRVRAWLDRKRNSLLVRLSMLDSGG